MLFLGLFIFMLTLTFDYSYCQTCTHKPRIDWESEKKFPLYTQSAKDYVKMLSSVVSDIIKKLRKNGVTYILRHYLVKL